MCTSTSGMRGEFSQDIGAPSLWDTPLHRRRTIFTVNVDRFNFCLEDLFSNVTWPIRYFTHQYVLIQSSYLELSKHNPFSSGMHGQTGPQGLVVLFNGWAQCELEMVWSFPERTSWAVRRWIVYNAITKHVWVSVFMWSTVVLIWFLISSFAMKPSGVQLVCVGSCGLNTLHNAFKCGFTAWQPDKLLRAMHTLFHNVPARREDNITVTKSSVFPLSSCSYRCVENLPVVERALAVWPSLLLYMEAVKNKETPEPWNR